MKKLLIFLLFMVICSPAFAIRVGKVDSDLENYMQVLYDSGELEAAVTDLTVSGLNGDDDETYEIISRIISDNQSNVVYGVRFNGDVTSGHYGEQLMTGQGTSVTAGRTDASFIEIMREQNDLSISFCNVIINASQDLSKTAVSTYADGIDGTDVIHVGMIGGVWNDTDEITDITFHSSKANAIGAGSRFIILRKVPDDSTGMKVGDLDIHGRVLGQWELVSENDITTAVTDLTISGLAGDSDVLYRLDCDLTEGSASNSLFVIKVNGDSGSNYGYQDLYGNDSSVFAKRASSEGLRVNQSNVDSGTGMISENLIYAKSGYERTAISKTASEINATTIEELRIAGISWNNTSDEITSLCLNANAANGIGIGSHIELWKLNLSEGDE